MLKKIATDKAPSAIGPYSQAIVFGNMLFTSGQIPINPASGNIEAQTITEQTEQVMKNLVAVLAMSAMVFAVRAAVLAVIADVENIDMMAFTPSMTDVTPCITPITWSTSFGRSIPMLFSPLAIDDSPLVRVDNFSVSFLVSFSSLYPGSFL